MDNESIKNDLNLLANNIDITLEAIKSFNNNCFDALVVNGMTNYKDSIIYLKTILEDAKDNLKNEIIKEIDNQII